MIRLSGHYWSRWMFLDWRGFRITESPISPDMEIGSHTFYPDKRDFGTIGSWINESSLYIKNI